MLIKEPVHLEPIPAKLKQDPVGDIVFVHGLGGDGYKTWTADKDDEEKYWPRWIARDFETWQVWSLYYPAKLTKWTTNTRGRALPLVRRANSLLNLLVAEGLGQRPLVFITHSLGGVITKQLLMSSATGNVEDDECIARNTAAVIFLATPHQGSNLASLGSALARLHIRGLSLGWILRWSPHIRDLQSNDANLGELYDWYKNNASSLGIETIAMAEQYPTLGVDRVVPEWSANPGIEGTKPIPVDADHFSIAKPSGLSSPIHKRVRKFLHQVTRASVRASSAVNHKTLLKGDDATPGSRLRLIVDNLEKYRRREPGKDIVYGTVELKDGTTAFGEGVLVHLTVENTAPHSSDVSGLCVRVEDFDRYPLEDFEYSEVAVPSTHLEVPGTTVLEPLQLTEVEGTDGTLRIPPGRLFLGPAKTPEAFHILRFPVVAHAAGRWRFRIEISAGLSSDEGRPPAPRTESVTVVKR